MRAKQIINIIRKTLNSIGESSKLILEDRNGSTILNLLEGCDLLDGILLLQEYNPRLCEIFEPDMYGNILCNNCIECRNCFMCNNCTNCVLCNYCNYCDKCYECENLACADNETKTNHSYL